MNECGAAGLQYDRALMSVSGDVPQSLDKDKQSCENRGRTETELMKDTS